MSEHHDDMHPDDLSVSQSPCAGGACAGRDNENTVSVTRRNLLKGAAATVGVVAAGVIPGFMSAVSAVGSESEHAADGGEVTGLEHYTEHVNAENYPGHTTSYAPDPIEGANFAMVIDVKACVGCRKCVYACVKENNIGRESGFTYIQVMEMPLGSMELEHGTLEYDVGGKPDKWYMPVQCMHCANPSCVHGCPVTATWRDPDGIVLIEYDKCIACRNCLTACPYEARHFNWVEPEVPHDEVNPLVPLHEKHSTVEKCTFCVQRVRNGLTTACTEACPVGARTFGDLNDPDSGVATLLRTRRSWRLKEGLGNEPAIWYVG